MGVYELCLPSLYHALFDLDFELLLVLLQLHHNFGVLHELLKTTMA